MYVVLFVDIEKNLYKGESTKTSFKKEQGFPFMPAVGMFIDSARVVSVEWVSEENGFICHIVPPHMRPNSYAYAEISGWRTQYDADMIAWSIKCEETLKERGFTKQKRRD